MRVVTGYSGKYEGLLYVTDLPLEELAKKLGWAYTKLEGATEFGHDLNTLHIFSHEPFEDLQELKETIDACGLGSHRFWIMHEQDVTQDVNLDEAVCW